MTVQSSFEGFLRWKEGGGALETEKHEQSSMDIEMGNTSLKTLD